MCDAKKHAANAKRAETVSKNKAAEKAAHISRMRKVAADLKTAADAARRGSGAVPGTGSGGPMGLVT
jgi:membrane protein involved in colicin uptake